MKNGVSVAGNSVNARGKDRNNNVEKIIITNPEDGFYEVKIHASDLRTTQGFLSSATTTTAQDFAIVASEIIGADSAGINKSGLVDYKHNFTNFDKTLYLTAKGLRREEQAHAYVSMWEDRTKLPEGTRLKDVRGSPTAVKADENGTIDNTKLWFAPTNWIYSLNGYGIYNIILDRNRTVYEPLTDLVDYQAKIGLRVQALSSTDKAQHIVKTFSGNDEAVYFYGGGFENNTKVRIVVEDFEQPGKSISDDNAGVIIADGIGRISGIAWLTPGNYIYGDKGHGRYLLKADSNGRGYYAWDEYNDSVDKVTINELIEAVNPGQFGKGSNNTPAIEELQSFLSARGFNMPVSGNFEEYTERMLNEYLDSRKRPKDGNVDKEDLKFIQADADVSFRIMAAAITDADGTIMRVANREEAAYAKGYGFARNSKVGLYIVTQDAVLSEGSELVDKTTNGFETADADENGTFRGIKLWSGNNAPLPGAYLLVVDVNGDGKYNRSIDVIDRIDTPTLRQNNGVFGNVSAQMELQTFMKVFVDPMIEVNGKLGDTRTDVAVEQYRRYNGISSGTYGSLDSQTVGAILKDAEISIRVQGMTVANQTGKPKSLFIPGEPIFAAANGLVPEKRVNMYIIDNVVNLSKRDGYPLGDKSGGAEDIGTDKNGNINYSLVWAQTKDSDQGDYIVIADVDHDDKLTYKPGLKDGVLRINGPGFTIRKEGLCDRLNNLGPMTRDKWLELVEAKMPFECHGRLRGGLLELDHNSYIRGNDFMEEDWVDGYYSKIVVINGKKTGWDNSCNPTEYTDPYPSSEIVWGYFMDTYVAQQGYPEYTINASCKCSDENTTQRYITTNGSCNANPPYVVTPP
jgi:hypothetical protein